MTSPLQGVVTPTQFESYKADNTSYINSRIANLFDPTKATSGFITSAGSPMASGSYFLSDFTPVVATSQYFCTNVRTIAFYDVNEVYIGGSDISYPSQLNNGIFRAPFGSAYVRFSSPLANLTNRNYIFALISNPTKYLNKIWSAFGDSITSQNTWQPNVISQLGMTMYNLGVGGTKVADTSGTDTTAMCRDERIATLQSTTDLTTFLGGTNDWLQDVPLGVISDTVTNTFYGALRSVINKIITRFPTKKLVLLTPPYSKYPNRDGWTDTTGILNNLNLSIADYGNSIITIGRSMGVQVIDLFGLVGWNDINISTFVSDEGGGVRIHPNSDGGIRMAQCVIGGLRATEPI